MMVLRELRITRIVDHQSIWPQPLKSDPSIVTTELVSLYDESARTLGVLDVHFKCSWDLYRRTATTA